MAVLNQIEFTSYKAIDSTQKVSGFEDSIELNSRFLRIERKDNAVNLILTSGIKTLEKERFYNLSNIFIPYNGDASPITRTPYAIFLLRQLNSYISSNEPLSQESHKKFTSIINITSLLIEYFSLKGCLGLSDISSNLITEFTNDIKSGWYDALDFECRFNLIYKEKQKDWFEVRSKKKSQLIRFKVDQFRQDMSSSLITRTLNDLPECLVSKINLPTNLRTPYKDSRAHKADLGFKSGYFKDIFIRLNSLLTSNGLSKVIAKPEALANKYGSVTSERTRTPSVEEVYKTTQFLLGITKTEVRNVLMSIISKVKSEILSKPHGTIRTEALADLVKNITTITIGRTNHTVNGYNQVRGQSVGDLLTVFDLYKTYVASTAYLSMIFTGWRLKEVVGKDIGITPKDFYLDYTNKLTVIHRYVEKENIEVFSKEKTAIGPVTGKLLLDLKDLNEKCSANYDVGDSLFVVPLAGVSGGSNVSVEFSSDDPKQNPLKYLAKANGVVIPTPKEFRRFFAVLYFYQFDHPDLLALSQHYGHDKLENTEVYVTNSPSRKVGKSIQKSIPVKVFNTSSDSQFNKIFDEARDYKLKDLIINAMKGESNGGFQATCRALWKKLFNDVVFDDLKNNKQQENIDKLFGKMKSDGYSVDVFSHGNCTNSEKVATSGEGHCSNNNTGKIEREHASGTFCKGCAFQDVQPQHILNLKQEAKELRESSVTINFDDLFSGNHTPLEIEQNAKHAEELEKIINLYEALRSNG
jgi:hypothetical protein